MSTLAENMGANTELGSGLSQGIDTISGYQELTFTLYVKFVLPVDGSVFWVNNALFSDSALYNQAITGQAEPNSPPPAPTRVFQAKGALHLSSDIRQAETENVTYNSMRFATMEPIRELNQISPTMLYVANYNGIRFVFNRRENFFQNAGVYHYMGNALYSVMFPQLIESLADFDNYNPVVTNSLPIWLTLNQYFPMYSSYLSNINLVPPYAVVHIEPSSTETYQVQFYDQQSNPWQLAKDKVKITTYGIRNHDALNFINYVFQYSLNTDNIGIVNMPVIQDEKQYQEEFGIISQRKTIVFDVSYYQTTTNNIARELIKEAFISLNEFVPQQSAVAGVAVASYAVAGVS